MGGCGKFNLAFGDAGWHIGRMEPETIPTISRVRGWLLIVTGSFLSVGMGVVAAYLAMTIFHQDRPDGTHWNGNHDFTVHVFELFGTVFLFGLVSIGGGIFQLRRGRVSWPAVIVLLGLVAVMYWLGQQIINSPSTPQ